MRSVFLVFSFSLVSLAVCFEDQLKLEWNDYKKEHSKEYGSNEDLARYYSYNFNNFFITFSSKL